MFPSSSPLLLSANATANTVGDSHSVCPLLDHGTNSDFVVLYDNSCGITSDICSDILHGIGTLILEILHYPNTSVQVMEFNSDGHTMNIAEFEDVFLQKHPTKFANYVERNGQCNEQSKGPMNFQQALVDAMSAFNLKDQRMDKLVVISACKHTIREKVMCGKVKNIMNKYQISAHFVNLVQASNAQNVIKNADEAQSYLSCLQSEDANAEQNIYIHRAHNHKSQSFTNTMKHCILPQLCQSNVSSSVSQTIDCNNSFAIETQLRVPETKQTVTQKVKNNIPSVLDIWPTATPIPRVSIKTKSKIPAKQSKKTTICPLTDKHDQNAYDFMVLIDNSCGMRSADCDAMVNGVGTLIERLLDNYHPTRVATVQFGSYQSEAKVLVNFQEQKYQKNRYLYSEYVRNHAQCHQNGRGTTDLAAALYKTFELFDDIKSRVEKLVIVSSCYDDREHLICNELAQYFDDEVIDIHIINLIKASNANNALDFETGSKYLSCLAKDTQRRLCTGPPNPGVFQSDFEYIVDRCIVPEICRIPTRVPEYIQKLNEQKKKQKSKKKKKKRIKKKKSIYRKRIWQQSNGD